MISERRRLLSWTAAAALFAGIAAATPGLSLAQAAEGGKAVAEARDWDGIELAPQTAFERAQLTVVGPDGYRSTQEFAAGETPFVDALGLADGDYRYELRLVTSAGDPEAGEEPATAKASGAFSIGAGQIRRAVADDAGTGGGGAITNDTVITLDNLQVQGDTCIGGTVCADGLSFNNNVGNADLFISSFDSQVFFADNDGANFAIEVDSSEFNIYNEDSITRIVGIDDGAFADSIFVGAGEIGIHTSTPPSLIELTVFESSGFNAELRLANSSQEWDLENAGEFVVEDVTNGGTVPFTIERGAGADLLVLDANNRVGIGTDEPDAALEVSIGDGSGRILVDESLAPAGNRTLLQLTNNGRAQVRLSNTATGVNWVTGMGTGDSYIIRRGGNEYRFTNGGRVRWFVGGDPNARFDYNNNGNLRIAGTLTENSDVNTKRDIVPVDGATVLARVAALPVSTWIYKEDEDGARHVGPMAQDFHAAFGLGADDTSLSPRDVAGVALAAVKELQAVVHRKDAELGELRERIAALEALIAK